MRGRLIQRFIAQICRLDRDAMRTSSEYEDFFREPVLQDPAGDYVGEVARRELTAIAVPCQLKPGTFEQLNMLSGGNSPISRVTITVHLVDLEQLGLYVDGVIGFDVGDRLDRIESQAGTIDFAIPNPPGLYLTQAAPAGCGIWMRSPRFNLAMLTFEDRQVAAQRFE